MAQLEEKGLLNVYIRQADGCRSIIIVIAPSDLSFYRLSTFQRFMEPPVAKLPHVIQ